MSRWKKEKPTEGAIYLREWANTEKGIAYRKRSATYSQAWRKRNPEKVKESRKMQNLKIKIETFTHYSKGKPICACCGEQGIPFLSIDHINGDGAKHRREMVGTNGKFGGNTLYWWLKKNGYPNGFQVLCYNCNFAKRTSPQCPHLLTKNNVRQTKNNFSIQCKSSKRN